MKIILALFISFLSASVGLSQSAADSLAAQKFDSLFTVLQGYEYDLDVEPHGKYVIRFIGLELFSAVGGKQETNDFFIWRNTDKSLILPNDITGFHLVKEDSDTIIDPLNYIDKTVFAKQEGHLSIGGRYLVIYFPIVQTYIGNMTDYFQRSTYFLERIQN